MGRRRRQEQLARTELFRQNRRLAHADVVSLGDELAVEAATLADPYARADLERALSGHEQARSLLAGAEQVEQVSEAVRALAEARFHQACARARRDGADLPVRRPPCFFDPAHGPASGGVRWTSRHGVQRDVEACTADLARLAEGEDPRLRLVRLGDRWVPWFDTGPAFAPWVVGWYGTALDDSLAWSDPGGWDHDDLGTGNGRTRSRVKYGGTGGWGGGGWGGDGTGGPLGGGLGGMGGGIGG